MICCVHKHTDYMKAYSAYILKNVSNANICLRFFSTFRYFDDEIQLILTNLADSWILSDIKVFNLIVVLNNMIQYLLSKYPINFV